MRNISKLLCSYECLKHDKLLSGIPAAPSPGPKITLEIKTQFLRKIFKFLQCFYYVKDHCFFSLAQHYNAGQNPVNTDVSASQTMTNSSR